MSDPREKLALRLAGSMSQPSRNLVDGYVAELAARRLQLVDDLALYRAKLVDLEQLDPLDFTGLGKLYRAHVMHIEALLEEFDGAGALP